jgi:hypothetical protein
VLFFSISVTWSVLGREQKLQNSSLCNFFILLLLHVSSVQIFSQAPVMSSCGFWDNWDTSGLEYFAPIKWLPQIYEVAHKGLNGIGT